MPTAEKHQITAEDLYCFKTVADARIAPNGRHVIFTVQRVDRKTEKKYTNLWLADTADGRVRQFTYGDHADTHPRWSPDGRHIAFLSNRDDEKQSQIYLLPFTGGEAQPLTTLKGTFATFAWSLDGRYLVCQFRQKDQEEIEREEDPQKKELGVVSRHITRVFFKLDDEGYFPQQRWHIWTIGVQSGETKQLTSGDIHDQTEPRWSPDGSHILFLSNRSDDPDLDPTATELYLVAAGGGEPRALGTPRGLKESPRFSPDGRWIAYCGQEGDKDFWKNNGVWVIPAAGGDARNRTAVHDLHATQASWSGDGQTILFRESYHGSERLRAIGRDGNNLTTLIDGPGTIVSFTCDQQQTKIAYLWEQIDAPAQVWLLDAATGQTRQLSHFNEWLENVDLGEIEEVWFEGDGENKLQGWILKPPGFDPDKKYPSILQIHGGPLGQYGHAFMHEFYFLAANGYVVYFSNPRGGRGYGEAHAAAIAHQWGTADYQDVMAWADYVAALPYIDTAKMGVTGGSYGGYLTNWIVGHTDRFAVAVTQRSICNMISTWGAHDFNWLFERVIGQNVPPYENVDHYWNQSPLKYAGNVKTPTLIIHSEQDFRCGQEQGEQWFTALKRAGVETELVLFPEEPHGLSRTGRTDRRIVRLNHILRWFNRYLMPNADAKGPGA